ncbi:MAG TPA: DUF6644 family protein [Gammaproteobacteria bacterium]|nr:DUF6644 family protein [Gammaproteobacteria bacterium]
MEALLLWLEGSALGQLMRASGVWAYGLVNLAHILGIATLFGSVLVLDLRLLGAWRRVPLAALEPPALTLAACGFILAVASGISLLTTNASEYVGNPFLPIKFTAIGLGLLNVIAVQFVPAWQARRSEPHDARQRLALGFVGGTSLVCWTAAVAAGRMLGYW